MGFYRDTDDPRSYAKFVSGVRIAQEKGMGKDLKLNLKLKKSLTNLFGTGYKIPIKDFL